MGAIYFNQSEYLSALELYLQALKIAEKEKDTLRIATVWQNIGAIHNEKRDFPRAIEAFSRALPLFTAKKNDEGIGMAYLNIGEGYRGEGDLKEAVRAIELALEYLPGTNYFATALRTMGDIQMSRGNMALSLFYLDSAYRLAQQTGDNFEMMRTLNTIGKNYQAKGDYSQAIRYFERGKTLAQASAGDFELVISAKGLVEAYAAQGNYKLAYDNQQIYLAANERMYDIESEKKSNKLLFNFDLEKKKNEIALLVKDKKIQQIEVERQKGLRNMFVAGFVLVVLFAVVVFRQRNKVKREKARSEELLLNILPEEVAEELKAKGSAEARLIKEVTVLFTDFKGFTALSEVLAPEELVSSLNECFTAFDRIIEKHGMEKIKTIGDAYMAAGGLPTPNETHAADVVRASLEIRDFMAAYKAKKEAAKLPFFEIRIGIHTGPVVAGIVGIKKFSYDIWGDTVNTASRMESSGEVGKVNISGTTYASVKDQFNCTHRGKISAKGKGEVDMYFVS
jgi:class 3 adenylate cyclase